MTKYDTLKNATLTGQSVRFSYRGLTRICSPHTLGHSEGKARVLAYQYAGESSKGLPPNGEWRCFDVDGIAELELTLDGVWKTGERHTRPQTCVKQVDAEWHQS